MKTLLPLLYAYIRVLTKQQKTIDYAQFGLKSPWLMGLITTFSEAFNLCLLISFFPLLSLFVLIITDDLGSNPIEAFHLHTGIWTLRFLCITLFVTPLQVMTKWRGMAHFRQLFGLMTFFYGAVHVYGYLAIDQAWVWSSIFRDISETTYIWWGLFCFIVLVLLALTSSKPAKKVMGRSWKKLHRWIYPASVAAVLHYLLQLKGNLAEPILYGLLIVFLLLFRVLVWLKDRKVTRLMIPKRPPVEEEGKGPAEETHQVS